MKVTVVSDPGLDSSAKYGLAELIRALVERGVEIEESSILDQRDDKKIILVGNIRWSLLEEFHYQNGFKVPTKKESYIITKAADFPGEAIFIIGEDDVGIQYGCFDLIEQIEDLSQAEEIFSRLITRSESPDLSVRGLYIFLHNTDLEREWFYSKKFWDRYFSMLARNRYNEFTLVFGHQTAHLIPMYPYFFSLKEYPDIWIEGVTENDQKKNLAMLQYISTLACKRGLKFFIGIWQSRLWKSKVFFSSQQSKLYGINDDMLADYTRLAVGKLLRLCPEIKGMQLRMNFESGITDQSFFTRSFIPAINDCGREIEVDIRNWGLRPETLEKFKQAFPNLRVSMKYFAEHQAMPYQPPEMGESYSYDALLRNDRVYDLLWQVWNLGTHRLFVWGDPDYVRQFAASCHLADASGFQVTPPLSQKGFSQQDEVPGYWSIYKGHIEHSYYRWEYERYWFFYALWGRIGYNPELTDAVWVKELSRRFGKQAAPHLFNAYRNASKVISYLISHHMYDPNMYIWLELDNGGLIDHFSKIVPGEKTLFMNSEEYVHKRLNRVPSAKTTPFQASRSLEEFARGCEQELERADEIRKLHQNEEYLLTGVDFKALCLLARYNSQKIRASSYLSLFYATDDYGVLKKARVCTEEALKIWKELVDITQEYFFDKLQLGPTGGHWKDNVAYVEYDLRRVSKVEEIFKRYGVFTKGFDFGAVPFEAKNMWEERSESVERRFEGVFPTTEYSTQRRYGWQQTYNLFAREAPFMNIWGLRGVQYFLVNREISDFPAEMLSSDFVGSKSPATFFIDIPNGDYRIIFLVGDNSESPTAHGPLSIFINGEKRCDNLAIPEGKIETVEEKVQVRDGRLRIDFQPTRGSDWIINALILIELKPHISHLFVDRALRGKDLTIDATSTSPVPLHTVKLYFKGEEDSSYRMVDMHEKKSFIHSASIPAANLRGDSIEYFIRAEDTQGNVSFLPRTEEKAPFYARVYDEYKTPRIIRHDRALSCRSTQPLPLKVEVDDNLKVLDVRVYYREVNQEKKFRVKSMRHTKQGNYTAVIPVPELDPLYDMMYYFEVVDRFGDGSFYPDPFSGGRYFVVRVRRESEEGNAL